MRRKLWFVLLMLSCLGLQLNAENTSKNLFDLTKSEFKFGYFEKYHKLPSANITFSDAGFCGNLDAELFLDQMITVLEKTPVTEDPPFYMSPFAIFVYGIVFGSLF